MRLWLVTFLVVIHCFAWSQHIPLNHNIQLEHEAAGKTLPIMRPVLARNGDQLLSVKAITPNDSLVMSAIDTDRSWFVRKLLRESFIMVNDTSNKVRIEVNPLMNIYAGEDSKDTSGSSRFYNNTRGVELTGSIENKVFFGSRFYENQAILPDYISDYTNARQVVPGQGRTKPFKTNGYDFSQATGYVTWFAKDWLALEVGNGKHFAGHGYRSILLSDQSFSYPYLRIHTAPWKGKLTFDMVSASLQNLERLPKTSATEPLFRRKGATFFTVNYHVTDWIQVGFFEATMWQVQDSSGSLPFEVMRLNPLPLLNTVVYGLDDANNVLLGINTEIRPVKWGAVYGQLAVDKVQTTRYAYQIGLKSYFWKLTGRVEYNHADPFMYRGEPALQNYSHYNEALAHPTGAYFDELLLQINFRHKRWYSSIQWNNIAYGDFGNNIFDLPSVIMATSNRHDVNVLKMEGGWIVNPVNQMSLFAGVLNRSEKVNAVTNETLFIHLGIRTNIRNLYYDF